MEIELRFFATFREAVGQKTIHREYADGATAGDVLREVQADFPDMELFDDGELRDYVTDIKHGLPIQHIDGLETSLADGDTLSVFPPVAGG